MVINWRRRGKRQTDDEDLGDSIRPGVPLVVSEEILAFASELSPGNQPVYLEPQPTPGSDPIDCFSNVDRAIAAGQGTAAYGWTIWLVPNIALVAKHYAVWRTPDGEIVDVTPSKSPRVLFLRDGLATFEGGRRSHVYHALTRNPLAHEWIRRVAAIDALKIQFGDSIPKADYKKAVGDDEFWLELGHHVVANRGRNDPCFCGSGKKYKHCCYTRIRF